MNYYLTCKLVVWYPGGELKINLWDCKGIPIPQQRLKVTYSTIKTTWDIPLYEQLLNRDSNRGY